MSSTHLSLYYHLVFSTHDRLRWIDKSGQQRLAHYIESLNKNGIEFDEKYLWQRVGRPSRGVFGRHSAFPGLRAALRRFTPGYCSRSASGA